MALKMRLLVVDAVVQLIEEDMDVDMGVGVGMGDDYHELAALLGIPYQTARSIIRVWLAEGHAQKLPEGGACNIKLTDDMKAFIRDEQEKLCNSLSLASPRLVRNWRFASQTRQFQTQPYSGTFKAISSPAYHHQDCWKGQRYTV